MFKMKELGVDLGSKLIKIAVVETVEIPGDESSKLNHLKEHNIYPVDCEPYSSEYFSFVKECVKDFAKENKIKSLSLNFTIPMDDNINNISMLTMPAAADKVIEEGVNYEAEVEMSSKGITNSYHTWKINDEFKETNEYEIILATVKKNVVNSFSQFKTITWKINRVLLQPIILERIVHENDVIIDLGHSCTRIYLYKEGKLAGVENIDNSGKTMMDELIEYLSINYPEVKLTDEIMDKLEMKNEIIQNFSSINERTEHQSLQSSFDMIEPESYKTEEDLEEINNEEVEVDSEEMIKETINELEDTIIDEDVLNKIKEQSDNLIDKEIAIEEEIKPEDNKELIDELSEIATSHLEILIGNIKRIIRSFELQNGLDVNEIIYFGELFNIEYLKESIEAEMNLELKPLDILHQNEDDNKTLYSLAGLASMDPKLKDKTDFIKYIKANIDYTSISIALLTLSLGLGITFKVINDKYDTMINELNSVKSVQESTMSELDEDIMRENESIMTNRNFIDRMAQLKNEKKWLSDALYVIPDKTPTTISIKNMDIVNEQVVIKGYASNYSSIGFFANELETIGEVEINEINKINDEVYTVILDDPKQISSKFKVTQNFTLTLKHNQGLLNH